MKFRILGPLEVEDQGRELPLGGPAERHLLAVLLCLANRPVPMQRLIDELWEDDPPASARNIVQQYVSRLRHALEDESRLTTEAVGYVLRVDKGELDWDRFGELVRQAHDTANRNHSAALLLEALGMWRGRALTGAGDGPTVAAERVRLEEARLTAVEDRINCELEMGRHLELTAELEALVAQHPSRERLLGHLMLALYRGDRQAEALRRFDDYRRRLGEETGLEPGRALTELESQILTDDVALAAPEAGSQAIETNLPQRLSSFVGRELELTRLAQRLAEHRLVTLVGTGGIGKTSLGLRAAEDMPTAFPDGVWWIDLAPISDASLVGGTAAAVLGVDLVPRSDPSEAVATHLRERVTLLVLDNCEHLIQGAADFAHSVLATAPDVSILATSREPLGVPGEALMKVPPLSLPDDDNVAASEAVRLFVDRARLLDSDFALDETNSSRVVAICRHLDGIPLAIELAAARLNTMALDQIADGVDDRYELLNRGARTAPERHRTLRAMMDWSHEVLTAEEQIVFRRLGAFAGTFTLAGATHVCGYEPLAPDDVALCLHQLVDASLVDAPEPSSDRFRMLETIREYAETRLDANEESSRAMRRLAEYLNEHGPASEEGYPVSDYEAWYAWREAESANFRKVLAWAIAARDPDVAANTAIEFRNYLAINNLAGETVALVDDVLELLGEETSHRHLRLSGFAMVNQAMMGDHDKAREMARELVQRATAMGADGIAGFAMQVEWLEDLRRGDLEQALEINSKAIAHLRAAGDMRVVDALFVRGFFLARSGRFEEARAALDEMLALALGMGKRYDNRFAEASRHIGTAVVAAYEGDATEAARLLDLEDEYIHHLGPDDLLAFSWGRWQVAFLNDNLAMAEAAAIELDEITPPSAGPDRLRDVAYMRALPALALRGPEAAHHHLCEALVHAHEDGAVIDLSEIATVVAESALLSGDYDIAAVIYAAATKILDHVVVSPWQRDRIDASIEEARRSSDPAGFEVLWEQGRAMTAEEMAGFAADYLDATAPS